ncbi:hypothetical protein LBMAG52_03810 [Planctomycetia bacterium]|nr:hypothetical protein LBMAG52_03810 [Planctomycetia bacterium]
MADNLDQLTVLHIAGDDDRAILAPLSQSRGGIEPQSGLLLFGSVTADAMLNQDRPHAVLEEGCGVIRSNDFRSGNAEQRKNQTHTKR